MKKQIIFIEPRPNPPDFKIARTLKLSGKYETILITFSKINKEYYLGAYDKIFVHELIDVPSKDNLLDFFKQFFDKKLRNFIKDVRKLNPYIVQITGLNIFTILTFYLFKNKKTIYNAYDIWGPYKKKFSLKGGSGRMIYFNTINERICFKIADGILHKGPAEELNLLSYGKKINTPSLAFLPGCLDEWNIKSKKRALKKDNINIVYAGGSWLEWQGHVSFLEIIKKITSQKIHFHISDPVLTKEKEKAYKEIERTNKYFHFYGSMNLNEFNKKLSEYDFGILPDFVSDTNIINPLFSKITMANKIFSYIESGLPVIVSSQLEFMKKIIEENEVGFAVKYEELENLREIIEKKDYKKVLKNISKFQKKFSLSKNISKIEKFYEEIYNLK